MCAIAGILDLHKRDINPMVLREMVDVQAHRGPNDEGIFTSGSVGLGHRRLSIIDLSKAGHQPMESGSGSSHIVLNGEIYNYIELKRELLGDYKSESDTEVLLHAYEKWGKECLRHLNGIFAFAIWDSQKKQLFAARDHLGVKPFYYAEKDGVFYFASEIKALLKAGIEAVPNDAIIYDYLVYGFYEHSEETFFQGIKQLMPGHYLVSSGTTIEIKRYWNLPEETEDLSGLSDGEISERYRALVTDSVRIQMRSDVPIGIPASGGLDCSILTSVVNEINGGQKNFNLYSWIYGSEEHDEKPYVEELACALGWSVEFFELSPSLAIELLPNVMEAEEQPFPGISIIARHLLYKEADKESIVMLEGHGGDEIGAGYPYYFANFISDLENNGKDNIAEKEIEAYAKLHNISRKKVEEKIKKGKKGYKIGGVSADATTFADKKYLSEAYLEDSKKDIPKFNLPFQSELANIQYRDLAFTKEPRVLRSIDRNSMAYGREVRVPFLDYHIVEFAFSLSPKQKIRGGEQRFFMREAFRESLPDHIINTPKRAVPDPQRDWLKRELKDWAREILTSKSFGNRHYFNQNKVLEEYDRYCTEPKAGNSFHIWQWLNLELWLRSYMD